MSNSGLTVNDPLDKWLAWQEVAHAKSWDFGLDRIGEVWRALGAPRLATTIITVAGTNGKGSCVRWLEELSLAHGISVGSFTSPHLQDYRERIRFQGQWVDERSLVKAFVAIDSARGEISLSYFEWSALAAFYLMANTQSLALAVLEVGLGGRLDATNIIDADAVIVTKIGLDHTQWLGETIREIAREKAAVMRAEQFVVFAQKEPPQVLFDHARKLGLFPHVMGQAFTIAEHDTGFELYLGEETGPTYKQRFHDLPFPQWMHGEHQLGQFAACVCTFAHFFALDEQALHTTLQQTRNSARLMHVDYQGAPWLLDVAHNADSAAVLATHIEARLAGQRVPIICGMLKDKDAQSVLSILDKVASRWYLVSLEGPRGGSHAWLTQQARLAGVASDKLQPCENVASAINLVQQDKNSARLNVVMGSFVTVGEVLSLMNISLENKH